MRNIVILTITCLGLLASYQAHAQPYPEQLSCKSPDGVWTYITDFDYAGTCGRNCYEYEVDTFGCHGAEEVRARAFLSDTTGKWWGDLYEDSSLNSVLRESSYSNNRYYLKSYYDIEVDWEGDQLIAEWHFSVYIPWVGWRWVELRLYNVIVVP